MKVKRNVRPMSFRLTDLRDFTLINGKLEGCQDKREETEEENKRT